MILAEGRYSMSTEIIETTLGDLIVALSEEMDWATNQRQEAYNLVAYLLADLFHNCSGCFKAQNYEAIKSMSDVDNVLSWQ
jgi:hypothetical protein